MSQFADDSSIVPSKLAIKKDLANMLVLCGFRLSETETVVMISAL